jgi:formamidopyrimidine-DNA glycosylase
MPELPEVETIVRAIREELLGAAIEKIDFYRKDLREVIPKKELKNILLGQKITKVFRRSKYIMIETQRGIALIHLGMSGNLCALDTSKPMRPHTHVVLHVSCSGKNKFYLHYVDPRRFGSIDVAQRHNMDVHKKLAHLGCEPLEKSRLGAYLQEKGCKRKVNVKTFLMDAKVVVGVGNIYACEADRLS